MSIERVAEVLAQKAAASHVETKWGINPHLVAVKLANRAQWLAEVSDEDGRTVEVWGTLVVNLSAPDGIEAVVKVATRLGGPEEWETPAVPEAE